MVDKLTDKEIEELRAKKKQIHDELYDKVKELIMIDETMYVPAEEGITPDNWVIIEVNHEGEQFQKVLSGWSGGYLDGDSWRLSSRIKTIDIKINQDFYTVETESGSAYTLWKSRQGLLMSNSGIYNQLKEKFGDSVEMVEL